MLPAETLCLEGKMIGGIFREGFTSKDARFEETEIVVSKKIK